jgi:hypothetical protein
MEHPPPPADLADIIPNPGEHQLEALLVAHHRRTAWLHPQLQLPAVLAINLWTCTLCAHVCGNRLVCASQCPRLQQQQCQSHVQCASDWLSFCVFEQQLHASQS